jgi:hypothetical protein
MSVDTTVWVNGTQDAVEAAYEWAKLPMKSLVIDRAMIERMLDCALQAFRNQLGKFV